MEINELVNRLVCDGVVEINIRHKNVKRTIKLVRECNAPALGSVRIYSASWKSFITPERRYQSNEGVVCYMVMDAPYNQPVNTYHDKKFLRLVKSALEGLVDNQSVYINLANKNRVYKGIIDHRYIPPNKTTTDGKINKRLLTSILLASSLTSIDI